MGILFGEKLSPEELQRRLQKIRNPQLKQLVSGLIALEQNLVILHALQLLKKDLWIIKGI